MKQRRRFFAAQEPLENVAANTAINFDHPPTTELDRPRGRIDDRSNERRGSAPALPIRHIGLNVNDIASGRQPLPLPLPGQGSEPFGRDFR